MADHADAMPLQILQLGDEENEVMLHMENLEKICETLRYCSAELVSIIAVMGSYRTGKSFLLDLLLRRMRARSREDERKQGGATHEASDGDQGGWGDIDRAPSTREEKKDEEHPEMDMDELAAAELRSRWEVSGDDNDQLPLPEWVYEGNRTHISEGKDGEQHRGFEYRPGKESCTQGIWIWSQPFMFVNDHGQRVGVLMMDTQGAWDNTLSKHQSATIFGLTAMISSKLIYNIQNKIEEGHIENLDYFTTFAQMAVEGLPCNEAPFGHLEILVRDWSHYEDGSNFQQCRDNLAEHLEEHMGVDKVPKDAVGRVQRLKDTFRQINCYGLVHPGTKITKKSWDGAIKDIDVDFFFLLDDFCSSFFTGDSHGGFPQPSCPLGCELSVGTFKQSMINFVNAFRDSNKMAMGLREAFVEVQAMTAKEEALKHFKERFRAALPESSVLDPRAFDAKANAVKNLFLDDFSQKLKILKFSKETEEYKLEEFRKQIEEAMHVRTQQNDDAVEGGTMKLVASPVVGLTVFFIFNHHWIVYVGGPVVAVSTLKKHAQKKQMSMCSGPVMMAASADGKLFITNRYKDTQAIYVAMNRLTPADMANAVQGAGTKAAMQVAAVQAAGAAKGPPDAEKKNN